MTAARGTLRYFTGAMIALFLLTVGGIATSDAQETRTPKVAAFLTDPGKLLKDFPFGGPLLSNEVQLLVLSDPSTFSVVLGLLTNANSAQKIGIAEGLAQAAKLEVLTNQALAEQWQQQIAVIDDVTFRTAATDAFGDVQLGAVGVGPLGGFGGGPAGPIASTGSISVLEIHSTPVSTPKFTITSNTAAGPNPTSPRPRPTSPVSP